MFLLLKLLKACIVVAIAGSVSISAAVAQTRSFVEVTGVGLASAKPDIATVVAVIGNEAETVEAARTNLTLRLEKATKELKEFGIFPGDFQLSEWMTSFAYECRTCASRVSGFTATQTVSVTVRELGAIDEVLSRLITGQFDNLIELRPGFSDPNELHAQAQLNSLENARKKAEMIAEANGRVLGELVSFIEEKSPSAFPLEKRFLKWATTSSGEERSVVSSSVVRFSLVQK